MKNKIDELIEINKASNKEINKLNQDIENFKNTSSKGESALHKKILETEELKNRIKKLDENLKNIDLEKLKLKNEIENQHMKESMKNKLMFNSSETNFSSQKNTQVYDDNLINDLKEKLKLCEEELKIKDFSIKRLVGELKQYQQSQNSNLNNRNNNNNFHNNDFNKNISNHIYIAENNI